MMEDVIERDTATKVPRLRFSGFTGEWPVVPMERISDIERGRFSPRPRNDPRFYGGSIPFVQTNDVVNCDGRIEQYSQTLNEEGLAVSKLFPAGTILMTIAANIGHTGVLQVDMACPDSLVGIKCKPDYHNYFLNLFLSTQQASLEYLAPEGAQKNINLEVLKPYRVPKPTLPEQQKIAAFLGAVDRKIQQLKRKQALLEQYKKGVVQQLFSQEIRFKREDGSEYPEWEEKRLGDILTIGSGRDYKHLGKGDVPVFGTGGYMLSVNEALYDGETVFIGRKGTIDKPFYFKGKFWTVDTLFYTHQYRGVTPQFVLALFQRINWREHNEASGVPSLSKATIEKIIVELPSLEEQTRIAGFLMALDAKVAGVAQAVEAAQKWKKGLLQQMFV